MKFSMALLACLAVAGSSLAASSPPKLAPISYSSYRIIGIDTFTLKQNPPKPPYVIGEVITQNPDMGVLVFSTDNNSEPEMHSEISENHLSRCRLVSHDNSFFVQLHSATEPYSIANDELNMARMARGTIEGGSLPPDQVAFFLFAKHFVQWYASVELLPNYVCAIGNLGNIAAPTH